MEENFTRPRLNVLESSLGFSIEVLGRAGLLYREGDHVMAVDSEFLALPHGIVVYRASIRAWQPPFQIEEISPARRRGIVDNIRRAFAADGVELKVAD